MKKKFNTTIRIILRSPSNFQINKYICIGLPYSTTLNNILPQVRDHFNQLFQLKKQSQIDWQSVIYVKCNSKLVFKNRPLCKKIINPYQQLGNIFQNQDKWNYSLKIQIMPQKVQTIQVYFNQNTYLFQNLPLTDTLQQIVNVLSQKRDFEGNFFQKFLLQKTFSPQILYQNIDGQKKQLTMVTSQFQDQLNHYKKLTKQQRGIKNGVSIMNNMLNGLYRIQLLTINFNYYKTLKLYLEQQFKFGLRMQHNLKSFLNVMKASGKF